MEKEELHKHSDDLCHEIEMMDWTLGKLKYITDLINGMETPTDELKWEQLCFLEAHLIHVRNLRDFLYHEKIGEDDDTLLADCFAGDSGEKWIRNEQSGDFEKDFEDLHKTLFHLTLERLNIFKRGIDYGPIVEELNKEIKKELRRFYDWVLEDNVLEDNIGEKLKAQIDIETSTRRV